LPALVSSYTRRSPALSSSGSCSSALLLCMTTTAHAHAGTTTHTRRAQQSPIASAAPRRPGQASVCVCVRARTYDLRKAWLCSSACLTVSLPLFAPGVSTHTHNTHTHTHTHTSIHALSPPLPPQRPHPPRLQGQPSPAASPTSPQMPISSRTAPAAAATFARSAAST
jgi:hypothetical protein